MLKIGSHVGCKSNDYFLGSVKEALSYDSSAFMLYTGAPQNSKRVDLSLMKIEEGQALWKQAGYSLDSCVVHCPYIINLANTISDEIFELSKKSLALEIERTKAIGAKYLVLHPGSHLKQGEEKGIEKIIEGLNDVLKDEDVIVCLETMAGKGSEVGYRFQQIKQIIDNVKVKVMVCMDSCHIWDSGYDLNNLDEVIKEFDEVIGLENLAVIHVNDSKNVLGARKDRHENLGKGHIGFDNIYMLVHHKLLQDKIFILETPYIDGVAPYKQEIAMLRKED